MRQIFIPTAVANAAAAHPHGEGHQQHHQELQTGDKLTGIDLIILTTTASAALSFTG